MSRITTNTFPGPLWMTVKFRKANVLSSLLVASIVVSSCDGGGQTRRSNQHHNTGNVNTSDNTNTDAGSGEAVTSETPNDANIEGSGDSHTSSPPKELIGSWIFGSPCNLIGTVSGGSTKDMSIFNDDGTFSMGMTLFSDKACSMLLLKSEISGTYATGDPHGAGQVINLDFETQSMTGYKEGYNSLASLCGQTTEVGKPFSARKGECKGAVDWMLGMRYAIFKLDGNTLYLGDIAVAEKDRPTSLPSKKESIGTRQVEATDGTE